MFEKKVILSCAQPTGNLHFGRYFGAVQNWVKLQSEYDCMFGVVDYHAITSPYNPIKLKEQVWELIYNMLACGIDKEKAFIQSFIPEHTELAWILGCSCSYGELSRMTQFKDKTQFLKEKDKDSFISAGLFTYPVLQAADILIYKAHYVPVGKDQEQHLELTRNIAIRFNSIFKKEYFPLPEILFTETPKIMSTADPERKMSASHGEKHNIDVFAPIDNIRKQIKSAVTDAGESVPGNMSKGLENLFTILRACDAQIANQWMQTFESGTMKYSEFKEAVGEALVAVALPLQQKKEEITSDKKLIKEQIKDSSSKIRLRAQQTIKEVKQMTGLG